MKPLKLYWSTSLQDGRKNFGDWLSPVLCEILSGRPVVHARPNRCDLMALGSILGKAKNHFWNRRIDIWGSGLIEARTPFSCPHRIHAVRGWKSAQLIRNRRVEVVGDPGLLSDLLISPGEVGAKTHSIGLIPHYVDQESAVVHDFLARSPRARLIDVFGDTRDFLLQVARCEVVLSSSLHGLIVSDALGVPNAWIRLSDRVWGADFKYHDYYSIYGIDRITPFPLGPETTEKQVLALADSYDRPGLAAIKQQLTHAFPFPR